MSLVDLSDYQVVLGSSSERRRQILHEVLKILEVKVIRPDFEENFSKQLQPQEYVNKTSREKMSYILKDNTFTSPTIIICCDTIIDCDGKIVEKPVTKAKQLEMFHHYKQCPQLKVISSVCIAKVDGVSGREGADINVNLVQDDVITRLNFDSDVSDQVLLQYIESEEGLLVAGGFKYQESGNVLFKSLNGDFYNVVGLPAKRTFELLLSI